MADLRWSVFRASRLNLTVPIPGDPPGEAAVVVGGGGLRPVVLYVAGVDPTALVATQPLGDASPEAGERDLGRERWSLVSTGTTENPDLVGIRLPVRAGAHAWLSDRVLVTAPPGAAAVQAVGRDGLIVATAQVGDRVAVLELGVGAAAELRAVDAAGDPVATTAFPEPATGQRLFDEPIINNW